MKSKIPRVTYVAFIITLVYKLIWQRTNAPTPCPILEVLYFYINLHILLLVIKLFICLIFNYYGWSTDTTIILC